MKNLSLLATSVVAALSLVACGSSKKAASSDYQYQQWKEQQEQQAAQNRPNRTLRTTEPCIELALADSEYLRAYGTATSYLEKAALSEAERDARTRLAQMIKVAVEGAAQDYVQNANKNLKNTAGSLGESVMTQYVAAELRNTRIIKTSVYDLSDGSVQVYVCLEMRTDKDGFGRNLNDFLDREGVVELQYDRERFIEKTAQGLEEYKLRNMSE
ncbi:MAG: hypothetical protein NC209_06795 [Alistipes sp.]|nr:hypothetical protein [Alistipes senegalensis]MCM1250833.1 hypothetical protein [Alistipes sp.]